MSSEPFDRPAFHLRVETSNGGAGEPLPSRFFIGERAVTVEEVIDRWLGSDHRYYKVRGDDGDLYILRHDRFQARWELTLFTSAATPAANE